jgi:hypothetical protein
MKIMRLMIASCVRALVVLLAAAPLTAQTLTQRGFIEPRGFLFPQEAPIDPARTVVDLLARDEVFVKPAGWIQFAGGIDLRLNSHDQVEDSWRVDFTDRTVRRPRLSVRRLTATFTRGWLTVDAGKQFIRWGKTDIVNPTDRFAPRDFLNVVDNDFLGVTGARAVVQAGSESLDVVWVPRFTPSRMPLLDQRWTVVPDQAAGVARGDVTRQLPARQQFGARWNHVGAAIEYSVSLFDGLNHLPTIDAQLSVQPLLTRGSVQIDVQRIYPAIRAYGADAAIPTRWLTLKSEAAYVTSSTPGTDEYALYVIQAERQTGEWFLVGGYAGEVVTERRAVLNFAPDRGLTRAFVGRASYTIDPNRSVALEAAIRQNGHGVWTKLEYSQVRRDHLRVTATATVIAGHSDDFLGQFRRNSHVLIAARYSF